MQDKKQQIVFAVEAIKKARNSLEEKMPVDITAICLKRNIRAYPGDYR